MPLFRIALTVTCGMAPLGQPASPPVSPSPTPTLLLIKPCPMPENLQAHKKFGDLCLNFKNHFAFTVPSGYVMWK